MCDREIGYDNIKTWLNILQRDNALLTKEVNKRNNPQKSGSDLSRYIDFVKCEL